MKSDVILCFSLLGAAAALAVQPPGAPAAGAAAKLSQLSWMQGQWKTTVEGNALEETWSAPLGDSIIGMFRWYKDGKLWMSEFFNITAEGDDVIFRLKHFDRAMVGWEEKGEALTMKLIRQTPDEAVFETDDKAKLVRITYRKAGPDALDATLESTREGQLKKDEFHFVRSR